MKRLCILLAALLLAAALGCGCGETAASQAEPSFTPEPTDTPEPELSEMREPYATTSPTLNPNADPNTPTAPFEVKRMGIAMDLPTSWLSVITYNVFSDTRMEIYHIASLDAGEGGLLLTILADKTHNQAACDEEEGAYFLGERDGLYYYMSTPVYVSQYDDNTSGEYKKLMKQLGTLLATFRFIEKEIVETPVPSASPEETPLGEEDAFDG